MNTRFVSPALRKWLAIPLLAAVLLLAAVPVMAQDPTAPPPDASCCTLEAAQANVLAAANLQAAFRNNDLVTIYNGAVSNWQINAYAHPNLYPASTEPQPPKSFIVVTDSQGWASVALTGPPVCGVPPIPADLLKLITPAAAIPPMNIDIGAPVFVGSTDAPAYSDTWFGVGSSDTYPYGKQTPPMQGPPDGGTHVYIKVGTAVGKGWYERVN